jgi:hypothetical protein
MIPLTGAALVWRWVAVWSGLGLVAGIALTTGDTGDLPAWSLPPLLATAGAAAGLLSLVLFALARRALGAVGGGGRGPEVLIAAAAGGGAMALLAAPLGIRLPFAVAAGVAAGLISGLAAHRRG